MSEFLRPRLVGPRFDDGKIPLELLADLSVLREMVIEVAKWRYLETNPDRRRSPKGFADGISITLAGVEKGSATPVIDVEFTPEQSSDTRQFPGMPEVFDQYLIEARDAIIDAIAAAERGSEPTDHLPEKYLGYFDRIGRRLRGDESIEFTSPTRIIPARLNRGSRRTLVLASRMSEMTNEVRLRAAIPEADQDRMSFELQLLSGRKIVSAMHDQQQEVVMEVFNGYRHNCKALIRGIGKYDRQGSLVRLESIEDIFALDPLDVSSRLDEFRAMHDGWLDGTGSAPGSAGLDWLSDSFERLYPDDLPLPHLFPTPEGGIEAEWSLGDHAINFEVDLNTHCGRWLSFDKQSDDDNEEDGCMLDLDDPACWAWLTDEVRRMSAERE